jgi:capsid protein
MDMQDGLSIERQECEDVALDPLFAAWLDEAVMVPGLLPKGLDTENLSYEWHWPGFRYLDPLVDAKADTEQLQTSRTKTYKQFFAEQGKDWREEFQQFAAEAQLAEELGLPPIGQAKIAITEQESPDGGEPDDDEPPTPKKGKNGPAKKQPAAA